MARLVRPRGREIKIKTMSAFNLSTKNISRKFRSFFVAHPERNWRQALALFAVAAVVLSVLEFLLFTRINSGEFLAHELQGGGLIGTINQEKLKTAVEKVREKNQSFESVMADSPLYADPSI